MTYFHTCPFCGFDITHDALVEELSSTGFGAVGEFLTECPQCKEDLEFDVRVEMTLTTKAGDDE